MFSGAPILLLATFVMVTCLILLVTLLVGRRQPAGTGSPGTSTDSFDLGPPSARKAALPRIGSVIMPADAQRRDRLKSRMLHAGLYRRHAMALFMGVKFLLMVAPISAGVALALLGLLPLMYGILCGAAVGLVGMLASAFWINVRKARRQKAIRRALPDALDVVVVCMEGGLSLPSSLARVAAELYAAHPLLASEMSIVRREIQLGRTTGEALYQFADRFDVEELRSLASVITQSERFGASIVTALRVHADALRVKRYQHAEAMAQRAPVKLIFPTVLFIFPALYVVLMGPAGLILLKLFTNV